VFGDVGAKLVGPVPDEVAVDEVSRERRVVHEPAPFAAAAPPVLEEPASAPAVSTPEPAAGAVDAPSAIDVTPPSADPSDR